MIRIYNTDMTEQYAPEGFTFQDAQKVVGGLVEVVRLPVEGEDEVMLVNEEGLLQGLPLNLTASMMSGGPIVGNVVVLTGKAAIDQVLGEA